MNLPMPWATTVPEISQMKGEINELRTAWESLIVTLAKPVIIPGIQFGSNFLQMLTGGWTAGINLTDQEKMRIEQDYKLSQMSDSQRAGSFDLPHLNRQNWQRDPRTQGQLPRTDGRIDAAFEEEFGMFADTERVIGQDAEGIRALYLQQQEAAEKNQNYIEQQNKDAQSSISETAKENEKLARDELRLHKRVAEGLGLVFGERELELGALRGLETALENNNIQITESASGAVQLTTDMDGLKISMDVADAAAVGLADSMDGLFTGIGDALDYIRQQAEALGATAQNLNAQAMRNAQNAALANSGLHTKRHGQDWFKLDAHKYDDPYISGALASFANTPAGRQAAHDYIAEKEQRSRSPGRVIEGDASAQNIVRNINKQMDYTNDRQKIASVTKQGAAGLLNN